MYASMFDLYRQILTIVLNLLKIKFIKLIVDIYYI